MSMSNRELVNEQLQAFNDVMNDAEELDVPLNSFVTKFFMALTDSIKNQTYEPLNSMHMKCVEFQQIQNDRVRLVKKYTDERNNQEDN